ncbi:hypothetical protein OUZ56_029517 [Daphnia magna]|uniref:Uncharacterized protein n=1 Tax=Daphnia magna TaxID=35525 RepID=A0ABR0B728_9CRUS|nr:hypothetical protein OUZ56_029517 [Daphnia magna]
MLPGLCLSMAEQALSLTAAGAIILTLENKPRLEYGPWTTKGRVKVIPVNAKMRALVTVKIHVLEQFSVINTY